jgi:hypothetical protein
MQGLFEEGCSINLESGDGNILTGRLDNVGFLAKIGKRFVLGKEGVWIPKDSDQKFYFVRIDNSSAYPNGLILSPYSDIDVDYHLKSKTIDKRTRFEREELSGRGSFVEQVFEKYYSSLVRKKDEKDQHFILYSTYNKNEGD